MKAATRTRFGGGEVLTVKDISRPRLADDHVLVKVRSATVNRTDCANIRGIPLIMRSYLGVFSPKHRVLGTDFAGTVEEIGSAVTHFTVGDRVFGFKDSILSSHAEYAAIATKHIAHIPHGVSFEDAAASIEGSHYFFNFLNKVSLGSAAKVLVNGGTGAIGSAAVQILKAKGATVTATGSDVDVLLQLGADRALDYRQEDFTLLDEKFDFVFDTVGKSSYFKCKHLLTSRGVYISSELGFLAQNVFLSLFRPSKVKFPIPSNVQESLKQLSVLLEEKKFFALIDRRYSLDDISLAYDYVETGHKKGSVLLEY